MEDVLVRRLREASGAVGGDEVPGTEGFILTTDLGGWGYETVVFGAGDVDVPDIGVGQRTCPTCLQWRYATREEAKLGHERVAAVILRC